MRGAYSHELRERVVQAVPHGDSCAVAAGRFDVSKSSAITWLRRFLKRDGLSFKKSLFAVEQSRVIAP